MTKKERMDAIQQIASRLNDFPDNELSILMEKIKALDYGGSEEYVKFQMWVSGSAPYCAKNLKPISERDFFKLKEQYTARQIAEVILDIENRKDLRKKYVDLYRTALTWLKMRYENTK